uniref:UPAR/Ly6 domain-containing protein n=1 Tax=Anabas testudineus TaxID=64144 RepID=A0A3Q1J6S8_ANATE
VQSCGITCYQCLAAKAEACKETTTCSSPLNRCFSLSLGLFTKGCQTSYACIPGAGCCEGDLCNSAITTGPSVILLLVSSAIITLFL